MRTIVKGREPASLAEYRASRGANYGAYRDKDALRTSLVNEQRGLCCYRLSRIRPEIGSMKIEHWHSQERHDAEQLDYTNLLASCMGNEGKRRRDQHCDTQKGMSEISRNPANPLHRVEEMISFGGDGSVSSVDPTFCRELDEVLNLNLAFLKNNRKATLGAFMDALPKAGELRRHRLERWLREWNGESGNGDLQPFCQVVVYWLRKRLARP